MTNTFTSSSRHYPRQVDVAIIGSGPAGATYARILSETAPDAAIVMVEAGPAISTPLGNHVKNIAEPEQRARAQRLSEGPAATATAQTDDTLDGYASEATRLQRPGTFLLSTGYQQSGEVGLPAAAMSSNVGGMAAHWTGACPRPGESEVIDFIEDFDELLSVGERLLGVSASLLEDAPLAGEVRKRLAQRIDGCRTPNRRIQPMPLAVRRTAEGDGLFWSGADVVFGEETRSNPNFTLFDESLAVRILTDDKDATVGIRVRDLRTGHEHEIIADFVVVAADSLRTPQLLHASGIRPSALGCYLNDQPQFVLASHLDDVPEAESASMTQSRIAAQSGVSWVPFTDAEPFHGQVMQLDASPVPIDDDVAPGSIVGLGWFCAKDVQKSDRVEFSDSEVDMYGLPAMTVRYTYSDRDRANFEHAKRAILTAAEAIGTPLGEEPLLFPAGASLHYQGSVRIGVANDGTSVADPHGQVWDVKGLFVAGNGTIPTATACNPTLTNVALAVRGARSIASQLGQARKPAQTSAL